VEHLALPAVDRFYSVEEGRGIAPYPQPGNVQSSNSPH
jgi:hypothetical protein